MEITAPQSTLRRRSYPCPYATKEVVSAPMLPLLLVPCCSSKSLPAAGGLRGRALADLPPEHQAERWKATLNQAHTRVPVRDLYKGGSWALAREVAANITRRGGEARVVSAGLGLVALRDLAPGYDITFTAGSPDLIPGGSSGEARAAWWSALSGHEALRSVMVKGKLEALIVALPGAYLDAVAPSIGEICRWVGEERVCVVASRLSPFSQKHIGKAWVPIAADQTTLLRGNAGQSTLSALLHALECLGENAPLTRPAIEDVLSQLARRETPLYPKRERRGLTHARQWIGTAIASGTPRLSASEALRRYRQEGFAYEQKAFHRLFAEIAERA